MPAKTILCVDDSPTQLLAMTQALVNLGHRVVTAGDGDEALRQVAESGPDLVLLDVVLPKKNGFQVCRQIKNAVGTRNIKVVLVTSKDQQSDRFWGLKQGADDYVTKPVDPETLAELVARQLE
ncbi:MAG: response regulator [Acidobacteria bacterium]|nr:response regulator [Acidobacteriota bacterium]